MIYIVEDLGNNQAVCKCSICQKDYHVKAKNDAKRARLGEYCDDCKYLIRTMEVTQENLRKAFNYNPDTGEFTHRLPGTKWDIGDIATTNHNGGYYAIRIAGRSYLAHRIAFMYMKGYFPKMVDHINHDRKDNRWQNLREVNDLGNAKNITLQHNSTTKINGVSYHKPTGRYRAYIGVDYKQKHLGLFDTLEEAVAARKEADLRYNYHPNHGNTKGSE